MTWNNTVFTSFYSFFNTHFSIVTSEITIGLPKYKYLPFWSGLLICVLTIGGMAAQDTSYSFQDDENLSVVLFSQRISSTTRDKPVFAMAPDPEYITGVIPGETVSQKVPDPVDHSTSMTDANGRTSRVTAPFSASSLVFDIGIFNSPANSDLLEIRIKPLVDIVNGDYTAGVFTVRVPIAAGVSLTAPVLLNSTFFSYQLYHTGMDGTYHYYCFAFEGSYPLITWNTDTEHTIAVLQHSGSCNGAGFFEIITPYTDGHINGSYYQELNGADAQNVIYQATASAPLDVIPPVAMCRNITVQLDNTGNGNTTAALVNNGSADICGIQSISLNPTHFTCANVGANTVTLTVTDISNNSSTCTATVTVTDDVLPVAICQNVTVNLDNSGSGVITESGVNNGSSDACGIQSFVLDQTTFTCADVTANPHTVTLTVTDVNGNVNTCGAIVTVLDPVGPTPVCPVIADIPLGANGLGTLAAYNNTGPVFFSTDNCAVAAESYPAVNVTCANGGLNTVTLTVLDVNGNSTTTTCSFHVEDLIDPVAGICPVITDVALGANGLGTLAAFYNAGPVFSGSDNCAVALESYPAVNLTCANVGPNPVMLTILDVNGNSATTTCFFQVVDLIDPIAICQNITVPLNPFTGTISITESQVDNGSSDACGISLSVSPNSFNCTDLGPNLVTLSITDPNSNISTCSSIVTVTTSLEATSVNLASPVICTGTSTNLSFTIAGGQSPYTIVYSSSPAGGTTTATGYTSGAPISVSPDVSTNYALVNVTDANGCVITAVLAPAMLTVNPVPSAPNTNTNACSEASVGFNLQHYLNFGGGNGVSADFSWYAISDNPLVSGEVLVPTTGNIITDVLTNSTTFPQSVTYRITPTAISGGCEGPYFDVTVIVYPVPMATATVAVNPVCSGSLTAVTVTNTPVIFSATFSWTANYGSVTGGAYNGVNPISDVAFGPGAITEVLENTTAAPINVIYTITPTGAPPNFCPGIPITVTVTVVPTVGPLALSGPLVVCQDDADAIYMATATNNTGIIYSVSPAAAGVINPLTGIMNWDAAYFGGPVSISATATGCNGSLQTGTLDVIVNPAPEMTITQPPAVCLSLDLSTVMIATTIPGGSYTYHASLADAISGSNALSGTAITAGTFDTYARYTISATGCFATGLIEVHIGACVQVIAKAMLQGPFFTMNNLMFDNLRTNNYIPNSDPYSTPAYNTFFVHVNSGAVRTINTGVLAVTGTNAIVDWVFLELRDKNDRTIVLGTRAALIQRDGDIVDMDGMSPVLFAGTNLDQYYLAVRHRNHLGVMTLNTIDYHLPPTVVNFTSTLLPVFGTTPTKLVNPGIMALWAGNAQLSNFIAGKTAITYQNSTNDRVAILNALGGNQLGTLTGYHIQDINMNGVVTYNNSGNDRVIILNNLNGNQQAVLLEQ